MSEVPLQAYCRTLGRCASSISSVPCMSRGLQPSHLDSHFVARNACSCVDRGRLCNAIFCTGGPDVIRKQAWPFYRTIFGVRICWELEEAKGPKGLHSATATWMRRPSARQPRE